MQVFFHLNTESNNNKYKPENATPELKFNRMRRRVSVQRVVEQMHASAFYS